MRLGGYDSRIWFFGVRIKVRGLRIRVWAEKTRFRVGIGVGIGHRTP